MKTVSGSAPRWFVSGVLVAIAMALGASTLVFLQGGFGGGHGDFDRPIFILGLPWTLVPWPPVRALLRYDYLLILAMPLALNLVSLFIAYAVISSRERKVK